mgnify:CR=1
MKFDIGIMKLAGALASHSYQRQGVIAENVANADTPGFRAKDLQSFAELHGAQSSGPSQMKATREGHMGFTSGSMRYEAEEVAAFGAESPNGNTVSLEDQMTRGAEVQHTHEMALGVYSKSLSIIRLGLGRRG